MIAIGLDPSLRSFGWAVVDTSAKGIRRRVASGHEATTVDTAQPARYLHLQKLVRDTIERFPQAQVVGIESPAYDAGPFGPIHHSLMMFSMVEIFNARKDCVLFDPATREYLIRQGRKGKISKLDAQRLVQLDTMDPDPIQNDEADAYIIGLYSARLSELRLGIIQPSDLNVFEANKFIHMQKTKKTLAGRIKVQAGHAFRENHKFHDFSRIPLDSTLRPSANQVNKNIISALKTCGVCKKPIEEDDDVQNGWKNENSVQVFGFVHKVCGQSITHA